MSANLKIANLCRRRKTKNGEMVSSKTQKENPGRIHIGKSLKRHDENTKMPACMTSFISMMPNVICCIM
jgi:hypothetical protein